tara:strand:+ start:1858 stop:2088 length:231 start_codon:yes stop_codon:yes gene_type:complete
MVYYKKEETAILAGRRKARAYRSTLQLFQTANDDGFWLATPQEVQSIRSLGDDTPRVNVLMTFVHWDRGPYERGAQ